MCIQRQRCAGSVSAVLLVVHQWMELETYGLSGCINMCASFQEQPANIMRPILLLPNAWIYLFLSLAMCNCLPDGFAKKSP